MWNSAIQYKPARLADNTLNQTVNDGVAHSKNPRKCTYHVTFDLDLVHTLDAGWLGVHRVQVWWRSGHLPARSDLRKSLQTDRRTDRRQTPRHCISSFLEWANNQKLSTWHWTGNVSNDKMMCIYRQTFQILTFIECTFEAIKSL